MTAIEQALSYFHAFESKDLARLADLLHPEVTLRDWTVDISGIELVLAEMNKAFRSFSSIRVKPINVFQENSVIIAELSISLDDEVIDVVDILEFSNKLTICSIRAFKG